MELISEEVSIVTFMILRSGSESKPDAAATTSVKNISTENNHFQKYPTAATIFS